MFHNTLLEFDKAMLFEDAKNLFIQINGLNHEHFNTKVENRIVTFVEKMKEKIFSKAVISYYDSDAFRLSGTGLYTDQVKLECPAFERIDSEQVKGFFVCFLCAGLDDPEKKTISEQMVGEVLEIAVVNAARMHLQKSLNQQSKISEAFGPGFFGMDVRMMHSLNSLVDASLAGIRIKDSGMLDPEKSCGLIFFDLRKDFLWSGSACSHCLGRPGGCSLCMIEGK